MRRFQVLYVIILVFSCASNPTENKYSLSISDLPGGDNVKESGKILTNQPYGFTRIMSDSANIDDVLVITVHGYESRGYEWIEPLTELSKSYNNILFYRNNWNVCPDILSQNLADSLSEYLNTNINLNKIIIFGHSYGGLIVTYLASEIHIDLPIEIHTIASPLTGYPRIMDKCEFQYDPSNNIVYPKWQDNIAHYQWRTQKEQDGAYKDLQYDPQDISIDNSYVTILPDSMDGHRLGHNWSVTWVVDKYINTSH